MVLEFSNILEEEELYIFRNKAHAHRVGESAQEYKLENVPQIFLYLYSRYINFRPKESSSLKHPQGSPIKHSPL